MLERQPGRGLTIKLILLTHAHPDHVADLDRLAPDNRRADLPFRVREQRRGAQAIEEGKTISASASWKSNRA